MNCDYDWINREKGKWAEHTVHESFRKKKTSGLNFRVKVSDVLKDIVKVKATILMVFVI